MERLEEEFCHLLAQTSRFVDPDWLFDSMAVADHSEALSMTIIIIP
jgi:hypothetical protein